MELKMECGMIRGDKTYTHTHTHLLTASVMTRLSTYPPHAAMIDDLSLVWSVYFVIHPYDVCIRKDLRNILTLTAGAQIQSVQTGLTWFRLFLTTGNLCSH